VEIEICGCLPRTAIASALTRVMKISKDMPVAAARSKALTVNARILAGLVVHFVRERFPKRVALLSVRPSFRRAQIQSPKLSLIVNANSATAAVESAH